MPVRDSDVVLNNRDDYPTWVGLIFIFNLIVGTGALTLPAVFSRTGWGLGLAVIIILAFISYMTVTFVIESMACANALLHWRRIHMLRRDRLINQENDSGSTNAVQSDGGLTERYSVSLPNRSANNYDVDCSEDDDRAGLLVCHNQHNDDLMEGVPLFAQTSPNTNYYSLNNKIELGEMAGLFLNNFGRIFFYFCMVTYLYGDLSIYSAAVAKSIRDVVCENYNTTEYNETTANDLPCWTGYTLTHNDCYRSSLFLFICLVGPFVFFDVSKTKYIQIVTILFRWLAFTIMISIALQRLILNGNEGKPNIANINGIPSLFGACIYSFMCHHSLPSIIVPIRDKNSIKKLLSLDYLIICSFYLFLAITGAFAFANLYDLYTLNFVPQNDDPQSIILKFIEYFLALFPVFTLSTSFPIIAVTLRNNLQHLFLDQSRLSMYNTFTRRILFPLLTIIPPIAITFYTDSVQSLVSFTGSYAGNAIQYLIPILLVYYARQMCSSILGHGIVNNYASPFRSRYWLTFVFIWSIACIVFVTLNFFYKM